MGFHKRWIGINNIIAQYTSGGVEAVKTYFDSPDAIIITDEETQLILDYYRSGFTDAQLSELIEVYVH